MVLCGSGSIKQPQRHASLKAVGWGTVFIFVSLAVFSPWMIRNLAWTGNSVYPLYNKVFNPPPASSETVDKAPAPRISHFQFRHQVYGESWTQIALLPIRVFFQRKDDSHQYFDGRTSPFLLILPLFAFAGFRNRTRQEKAEILILLFFSVLFLLYACLMTSVRVRYFSPILPPLVVLSMFGFYNIQKPCGLGARLFGPARKWGCLP